MGGLIKTAFGSSKPKDIFQGILTFDRLLTKPVIHLIYWAGLALLVLGLFAVVGGTIGIAFKEEMPWGLFLALPFLIGGLVFLLAALLLWRSFCELYVALFRIAEDLRFLRTAAEQGQGALAPAPVANPTFQAPVPDTTGTHLSADDAKVGDALDNPFFPGRRIVD
ncbi:DUF4282 domain-containing protein [Asticcacaulis sp. YBE204]|uniref:DUF4282 domain-containing protein n=1 Tax=Asticcacaulis sp. YBE204 TaxID=1282363 RepID=UPI0003C3F157|nr:DUF4282 domain-containing protein [Asticcacaulis sp. YBE204]ESQ81374.1 hypothetical protein AEYBE204_03255 [Asticcacaulis sp. YBE204]